MSKVLINIDVIDRQQLLFLLFLLMELLRGCRSFQDAVLECESLFLVLDGYDNLGVLRIDDGFCVHKNGLPKMMVVFSFTPVSTTTKSIGTYDFPTLMKTSFSTPLG